MGKAVLENSQSLQYSLTAYSVGLLLTDYSIQGVTVPLVSFVVGTHLGPRKYAKYTIGIITCLLHLLTSF